MSHSSAADRTPESQEGATNSNISGLPMAGHGARAEYIRIARALLGVTPAQLASQIGVPPPPPVADVVRPTQTLDRLFGALQAVIGWYHTSLGSTQQQPLPEELNALALDTLVHQYLALRSNWENREAIGIAARMTQQAVLNKPASRAPLQPTIPKDGAARRIALLVDDASDVVVTVGAFLEAFGFEVLRTSKGDQALQILATGAAVDLLVTDHAMPGMTGKDLAVQACAQRPTLRVLIITGYPDADDLASLPARMTMLAKPFRRSELREAISELFTVHKTADANADLQKAGSNQG